MDTAETVFNLSFFYHESLGHTNYFFAVLYLQDLRAFDDVPFAFVDLCDVEYNVVHHYFLVSNKQHNGLIRPKFIRDCVDSKVFNVVEMKHTIEIDS